LFVASHILISQSFDSQGLVFDAPIKRVICKANTSNHSMVFWFILINKLKKHWFWPSQNMTIPIDVILKLTNKDMKYKFDLDL
jgi:hypothetical protein